MDYIGSLFTSTSPTKAATNEAASAHLSTSASSEAVSSTATATAPSLSSIASAPLSSSAVTSSSHRLPTSSSSSSSPAQPASSTTPASVPTHLLVGHEHISLYSTAARTADRLPATHDDDDMTKVEKFAYVGDNGTLGQRWEQWLERFQLMVTRDKIGTDEQKSTLLLAIDTDTYGVYKSLALPSASSFKEVHDALTAKFVCAKNELVEETKFMRAMRRDGESVDEYATRLRVMASHCGFETALEKRITSQFIVGSNMPELALDCAKLEKSMDLKTALAAARGYERQSANLRTLQAGNGTTVHYSSSGRPNHSNGGRVCRFCAKEFHERANCPAREAKCNFCGKSGHYEVACESKHGGGSRPSHNSKKSSGSNRSFSKSDSDNISHGRSSFKSSGASSAKSLKWANPEKSNSIKHVVQPSLTGSTAVHEGAVIQAGDMEEFLRWKRGKALGIEVGHVATQGATSRCAYVGIGGSHVRLLIDTGAPINILDQLSYEAIASKPTLLPCNTPYFGLRAREPLPVIGQFTADVDFSGRTVKAGFIVLQGRSTCLLSCKTSEELGVIVFNNKLVAHVASSEPDAPLAPPSQPTPTPAPVEQPAQRPWSKLLLPEHWQRVFPDLFSDKMGCIRGVEVVLDVDDSVPPVKQALRPIAVHLRNVVEKELLACVSADILERHMPSFGPTTYISNLVVVPKGPRVLGQPKWANPSGTELQVRLTYDCGPLNANVRRTRHPTRTLEDIVYQVDGSKFFCKLDITKAFHQVMLAEESRHYTTITTHVGLFRYKRLHMGISCASELFSEIIRRLLEDCEGQLNMTDDILVFGRTREEVAERLYKVCRTLEQAGVTLNLSKCQLFKEELTFFGLNFSKNGIAPTEDRCRALRNASPPSNPSELRSLLGSAMWSGRFIRKISTIVDVLWPLTGKKAEWRWTEVEQKALDELKAALTGEALAYFSTSWRTEVHTDASPVGLSSILIQVNPLDKNEKRVICYASRRLTDVERRYSQCEKEGLAAVWGCERYWVYLFGSHFTLVTDNRAIQMIFSHGARRPPARIERLALRLSQFNYTIVHSPGESNIADYFSRHPDPDTDISRLEAEQASEHYVNFIVENSMPAAIMLTEMANETRADAELQELSDFMRSGAPLPVSLKQYAQVLSELSMAENGILMRGQRILVPKSLRSRVAELAHRGHQGIVKTKSLVRSRVWYPGIDAAIEERVLNCPSCQVNTQKQQFEPMVPSPMPDGPWRTVHGDFFGPMSDGTYWFVNRCAYSRYTFVRSVKSTSFECVKKVLDEIFSFVGRPNEYVSDNGSPFQSSQFADFLTFNGVKHRRVTPLWPQANGEVERFMASLGKVLRNAKAADIDKEVALREFLRAYHETPHSTTKFAPAMLMFGFSNSSGIPSSLSPVDWNEMHRSARSNDEAAKALSKANYDKRMRVQEHKLVIGMKVWVKRKSTNKAMSGFDPDPYVIDSIKGRSVTASRRGSNKHVITRNSSHFKPCLGVTSTLAASPASPSAAAPVRKVPPELAEARVELNRDELEPAVLENEAAVNIDDPADVPTQPSANSDPIIPIPPISHQPETPVVIADPLPVIVEQPKLGRPGLQQEAINKLARQAEYERQRAANPASRSSARLRGNGPSDK